MKTTVATATALLHLTSAKETTKIPNAIRKRDFAVGKERTKETPKVECANGCYAPEDLILQRE